MSHYALLPAGTSPTEAVQGLLKQMLSTKVVAAVLVQARTPHSALPMPTLFTDPDALDTADPLAPVAPFNAARQAAAVTRRNVGKQIALVLRPCELRAWIELTKLNQCSADNVLLISFDCPGRMENDTYLAFAADGGEAAEGTLDRDPPPDKLATACSVCDQFIPRQADLSLCMGGSDPGKIVLAATTDKGREVSGALSLKGTTPPDGREAAVAALTKARTANRDASFADTSAKIADVDTFQKMIATCLNCYNCRTACPVCYCKECVFLTDVFAHGPETLLPRAEKKGLLKLPTETTMFHLTRLAHMAHACVGCGQCSSVCPSHIPVADIFITVAARVQETLAYNPGEDPSETIPYLSYGPKKNAS